MTDDVEIRLRAALQYNADRVELAEPELRPKSARRLDNRVWATLAAAACVVTIVGATVLGRGLHRGATAAPSYEGRHWILASVVHAGKTTAVPAKLAASIDFNQSHDFCAGDVPSGTRCLSISDSLNSVGASYRRTEQGFVARTVVSSGAGSTGKSVVRDGMDSVGESAVTASVDGSQLTLSTPGYILIFTAANPQTSMSRSYAGRHWRLTSVSHNGATVAIPARVGATIDFSASAHYCGRGALFGQCPGKIGINDSVNFLSGSYRLTVDGFATTDVGTTLVLYAGPDTTRKLVISAMDQVAYGRVASTGFSGNADVRASVDRDVLTLTVPDYVLTLTAQGKSRLDTSSPSPTTDR